MRTIKTADGIKKIDDCTDAISLIKIREILIEHRNALVSRLILDLSAYIHYRFSIKANKEQLQSITEKLYSIKHSGISLDKYDQQVQEILAKPNSHLSSQPFYNEIDKMISSELNDKQMLFVK